MQLDLIEILNEEQRIQKEAKKQKEIDQLVVEHNKFIGMDDYTRLKQKSLKIREEDLPWRKWELFPYIDECDLRIIIPPNALSSLEYYFRFENTRYDDPVVKTYHDLWGKINYLIWNYKPHRVDWCGAFKLLTKHRDAGEPIWTTIWRSHGRFEHLPESIIEVK